MLTRVVKDDEVLCASLRVTHVSLELRSYQVKAWSVEVKP